MVQTINRNIKTVIDLLIIALIFCGFMAGFYTGENIRYKKDKEYYENLYAYCEPMKPIEYDKLNLSFVKPIT